MKATYDLYPLFLREETTPFRAAVAFYPYCGRPMHNLNSPLLILIGEKDDWTLAENCLNNMPSEPTEHEVILKVYPGAYHAFDWEGMDRLYKSHRLLYEPTAAQDSIIQAKSFLAKHLK